MRRLGSLGRLGSSGRGFATTDYVDENTYTPPVKKFDRVVLTHEGARKAASEFLAAEFGLFMVGRWQRAAQRFKEVEESKWGNAKKKAPKRLETSSGDLSDNVQLVTGAEKDARVEAFLQRLKVTESSDLLRSEYADEIFQLAQNDASEGETHTRPGTVGLSAAYYAEDFGAFRHRGQLYDGEFGAEEERQSIRQTDSKLRGMLVEHGLLPNLQSSLWHTDDVDAWRKWARDGTDPGSGSHKLSGLNIAQVADVVSGIITDGWAPGTMSNEHSEAEWKRREELAERVRAQLHEDPASYPIHWTSKSFIEPAWTGDEAKRRWRERKVVLQIDLDALKLPNVVRERLAATLGPRLHEGRFARVVADKYDTKEENRLYSLLLMRSLITDAWEAHPRFVRVNETREELLEQHRQNVADRIRRMADESPLFSLISVRFQ